MLDSIDQRIFLKNFFSDYEKTHKKSFRFLFGNEINKAIDDLTEKLVCAMKERPEFFNYVCEVLVDKDEVRIPIQDSETLMAMLSYFKSKKLKIQRETGLSYVPESLQDIIGALQTKYSEMKAKEEEELEKQRLIELEKKELKEYERLKKKYGK